MWSLINELFGLSVYVTHSYTTRWYYGSALLVETGATKSVKLFQRPKHVAFFVLATEFFKSLSISSLENSKNLLFNAIFSKEFRLPFNFKLTRFRLTAFTIFGDYGILAHRPWYLSHCVVMYWIVFNVLVCIVSVLCCIENVFYWIVLYSIVL